MGLGPRQLGHLVVNVRDLDRSEDFYTRIIGLKVMQKYDGHAVFMSANDAMSHEMAIVSVGADAPGPEQERVGLLHMAWQMESLEDLKAMDQRLKDNDIEIEHYGDHGLSLGIYFRDPDGNEIETYYEVPRSDWVFDGEHLFDQRKIHFGEADVPEILEGIAASAVEG
ncbi:MAG: glyoxalase [Gammaproteobacteria bacterium]|nr:glyoxalase [Gammaproteobacteria bacterium]|tara:strand:- start:7941 stop:8444 length:504 start_codon:yes stop_codon:yes gene_type:complete